MVYDLYKTTYEWRKYGCIVLAGALLGALPQVIALLGSSTHFFSRANNTMKAASFSFGYLWSVVCDMFSNLMPGFLFVQKGDYNNLSIYRLIPAALLFFYAGIFVLPVVIKPDGFKRSYIYLLVVFSLLPAALAYPNPNALRVSGMVILLPLFSASGVLYVYRYFNKPGYNALYSGIVVLVTIVSFGAIINEYIHSPLLRGKGQQNILVRICTRLNTTTKQYKSVVIKYGAAQRYLYVSAFCGIAPEKFQHIILVNDTTDEWDHVTRMDKYYFIEGGEENVIATQDAGNRLLVSGDRHLPYCIVDSVDSYGDKAYFYRY